MGELGKILPKPAWPLFETTLLGAQLNFAIALGCRKIFVNTHHLHEKLKITLPVKYRSWVTFVFEREILGSGGGVHNLVEKNFFHTDKLLTLNSDTFFLIPRLEELKKIFAQLSDDRCILLGADVSSQSSYKKMIINDGYLTGFDNFSKKKNFITYSGMGLINLKNLIPVKGKSNFFDSVANFKKEPVRVVSVAGSEFWDFGTKEYYKENIYRLIKSVNLKEEACLINFLKDRELIDFKKIGEASYNDSRQGRVNFTSADSSCMEADKDNIIMIEAGEKSQIYSI